MKKKILIFIKLDVLRKTKQKKTKQVNKKLHEYLNDTKLTLYQIRIRDHFQCFPRRLCGKSFFLLSVSSPPLQSLSHTLEQC